MYLFERTALSIAATTAVLFSTDDANAEKPMVRRILALCEGEKRYAETRRNRLVFSSAKEINTSIINVARPGFAALRNSASGLTQPTATVISIAPPNIAADRV